LTLPPITHLATGVPPVMVPEHAIPSAIKAPLQLLFVVGWASIYLMAIRRGFIEKWLCIPLIALPGNFAWEFMFSFIFRVDAANRVTDIIWFSLDLMLVVQALGYGRRDYPLVSQRTYWWSVAGLFAFAFGFMYTLPHDLGGDYFYAALLLGCFLSYMFMWMLHRRNSTAGQTMYIGAIKLISNVAASTVSIGMYPHRLLFDVLCITTLIFDVLYLVQLRRAFHKEGIAAWRKI
jgi:hypothetical protein